MALSKYKNPVIPGFNPDPSVCRAGDDFYLVTSSFEYFPGVPIYHSKDLIHWEQIGYCLTRPEQLRLHKAPCSGGIWAPTIRYYQGIFYMTTTNMSDKGNFYVTAKDPAGPWSDPIWVAQGGIDPSLFFDDDGRVYYQSTGTIDGKRGIVQSEIDIQTGKLLTDIRFLWTGTGGCAPEGPHLYKINGMYYLMIAEGGTEYGHMETIARSSSPWGPFESCPYNPILTHRNRKGYEIQGTGHMDLVQSPDGRWWGVHLAFRTTSKYFHHLGRETFLVPVEMNEQSWPVVNHNGMVDLEMEAECLPFHPYPPLPVRDDFDGNHLSMPWNYLRNPCLSDVSLAERPSWICLKGNEFNMSAVDSPAFVGRRQQHFDCKTQTLMEFNPVNENEEAGITVYVSSEHHYDFFIRKVNGVRQLMLRRVVGDINYIAFIEYVENRPVILEVSANKLEYTFSYGYEPDSMKPLGKARTQFLSTEAGILGFVGVYFGLYATGNGQKSKEAAYFDWFEYQPLS